MTQGPVDKYSTTTKAEGVVDSRVVEKFHRNSDNDASKIAQHHTIGPGPFQVASGVHTHDGGETRQLLAGVDLTGSKSGGTALPSIIAALVALGATDNTTA